MAARTSFALALAAGAALHTDARSAAPPLEKAVSMLEEVKAKVEAEGEAEAKTYNTFACFCKDTQAEKLSSIDAATIQKDELQAAMNEAATARDGADEETATVTQELGTANEEIERLTSERHAGALEYEKNEVDLTGAIQALSSAISELKAAQQTGGASSLLQTLKDSRHFGMVRRSLLMAEVLSGKNAEKATAALSALQVNKEIPTGDLPTETYSFHSGDIITTLEDLKTEFKSQKDTLDQAEVDAKHTYHTAVQDQEKIIEEKQKRLTELKDLKAEKTELIAQSSTDLTAVSAQLLDDQKYLSEVSAQCAAKGKLWDQRTTLRANELQALTQATTILGDIMAEPEGEAASLAQEEEQPKSFVQVKRTQHPGRLALRAMRAKTVAKVAEVRAHEQVEEVKHAVEMKHSAAVSSSSSSAGKMLRSSAGMKAEKVAALLRAEGKKLDSQELMLLASKAAEDPFAKVKQLIQDLIERLLKEAAEEANHKGWCDGEIQTATNSRDQGAAEIQKANERMGLGEARRAKLKELVATVEGEIDEVKSALNHTEVMREQDKAQNEATIEEAQKGADAVNEAKRILSEYYGAAAKGVTTDGGASFIQLREEPAAPDAGFDGEYTGAQSASGGVIAMLDVIISDFERQIKDAEEAEKKGEADLLEMQTVSGSSIAEKEEVSKAHSKALSEAEAEYEEDQSTLNSNQDRLDKALAELDSLYKACFDGGETAEERKAKRDEEMAALKQALCILDSKSGGAEC